jgi:hypothetical protein
MSITKITPTDEKQLNYTTVDNEDLEDKIGGKAENILGKKSEFTKEYASTLTGINEGSIAAALVRDNQESLSSIKARAADSSTAKGDPKLLKNLSTARVEASNVAFTEARAGEFRQRAMMESILENEIAGQVNQSVIDRRDQMAGNLEKVMKDQPIPDATTYNNGRKIHVPAEVTQHANMVSKEEAMEILETVIGPELTSLVILSAQAANFFEKPHLWLGQKLFFEMSTPGMWDKVEIIPGYSSPLSDEARDKAKQGIARIMSWHIPEQVEVISRIRNLEFDHILVILVKRICQRLAEEKSPLEGQKKYDDPTRLAALAARA